MEEADLDFKNLMRALHDVGGQGRLMCESPLLEANALKFKALWLEVSGEE
jgi:endonuclease IV